jgi:hypothetical protein
VPSLPRLPETLPPGFELLDIVPVDSIDFHSSTRTIWSGERPV